MIFRKLVIIALLAAAGIGQAAAAEPAAESAPVRVGFVCEGAPPEIDLAVADLSGDAGIALLERSRIDAALGELEFAAAGLAETGALALGKIVGVELFAVVETTQDKNEALGVVVYDAGTGVRYHDAPLAGEGIEDRVAELTTAVRAASKKCRLADIGELTFLSLVAVRNVALPFSMEPFRHAFAALFTRQLNESPDIAILERRYLEHLVRERSLPGGEAPVNELLNATAMLEIELRRDAGGKGVWATVFLDGEVSVSVEGQADPGALAASLAEAFWEKHSQSPPKASIDYCHRREVARIIREINFIRHSEERHEKLMAVHALMPEERNPSIIKSCWNRAIQMARRSSQPSLQDFEQSLDLLEFASALREKWYDPDNPFEFDAHYSLVAAREIARKAENDTELAPIRDRAHAALLDWHRFRLRKIADFLNYEFNPHLDSYEELDRQSEFLELYLRSARIWSFPEWFLEKHFLPMLEPWVDSLIFVCGKRFPDKSPLIPENAFSVIFFLLLGNQMVSNFLGEEKLRDEELVRRLISIKHLLEKMRGSGIPHLSMRAKSMLAVLHFVESGRNNNIREKLQENLIEFAKIQIQALDANPEYELETFECYNRDNYDFLELNHFRATSTYSELFFDFMVSRNELIFPVMTDSISVSRGDFDNNHYTRKELSQILSRREKTLELLEREGTRIIGIPYKGERMRMAIRGIIQSVDDSFAAYRPELLSEFRSKFPESRLHEGFDAILEELATFNVTNNPVIKDNQMYFLSPHGDSRGRKMVHVDLSGKEIKVVDEYPLEGYYLPRKTSRVPVVIHGDHAVYSSRGRDGLRFIPLKSGVKQKWIFPHNSYIERLPANAFTGTKIPLDIASNQIIAFDIVDDTLFMFTGDNNINFYSYGLTSGELKLLRSDMALNIECPLFKLKPESKCVTSIFADPPRNRLLLAVGNTTNKKFSGLWEYSINNDTWRKIPGTDLHSWSFFGTKGRHILLYGFYTTCYTFDPVTDELSLVYSSRNTKHARVLYPALNNHRVRGENHLLTQNYLWLGSSKFLRIKLTTGEIEELPIQAPFYSNITANEKYLVVRNISISNIITIYRILDP